MEPEKITDIHQLKKGDKIWTIDRFSGDVKILEFVCIHPHDVEYSIFLNETYDGIPKFYNKNLANGNYERYDDSAKFWKERIYPARISWFENKIQNIRKRINDFKNTISLIK